MLEISPALRRWQDIFRFGVLTLIATATSSVGAMLWSNTHDVPFSRAQAIWQGWVIGDSLQILLVVGPLLFFGHIPAQKWLASQITAAPRRSLNVKIYLAVFILVFVAMIASGVTAGRIFFSSLTPGHGETIPLPELVGQATFFVGVYGAIFLAAMVVFSFTLGTNFERILAARELQNKLARYIVLSELQPPDAAPGQPGGVWGTQPLDTLGQRWRAGSSSCIMGWTG